MIKVKENEKKIDMVSDFVSSVINLNKDCPAFEGAYVSCRKNSKLNITLGIVWSDYHCCIVYPPDEFERERICKETDFNVEVYEVPLSFFRGEVVAPSIAFKEDRGMLKNGSIIYDRNGHVTKLQNLYRDNQYSSVDILDFTDCVQIEPPIQYKKK